VNTNPQWAVTPREKKNKVPYEEYLTAYLVITWPVRELVQLWTQE